MTIAKRRLLACFLITALCLTSSTSCESKSKGSNSSTKLNERSLQSTSCTTGCDICSTSTYCSKCLDGYYSRGSTCNKCTTGCSICSSSSYCSKCSDGYSIDRYSYTCKRNSSSAAVASIISSIVSLAICIACCVGCYYCFCKPRRLNTIYRNQHTVVVSNHGHVYSSPYGVSPQYPSAVYPHIPAGFSNERYGDQNPQGQNGQIPPGFMTSAPQPVPFAPPPMTVIPMNQNTSPYDNARYQEDNRQNNLPPNFFDVAKT